MRVKNPKDGTHIELTPGELADLLEIYMKEAKFDEAYVLIKSALPGVIYALRYADYGGNN